MSQEAGTSGESKLQLSTLDVSKLSRTLVSIEYPGQVKNDKEALRTMGGIDAMSAVHSKENRK